MCRNIFFLLKMFLFRYFYHSVILRRFYVCKVTILSINTVTTANIWLNFLFHNTLLIHSADYGLIVQVIL